PQDAGLVHCQLHPWLRCDHLGGADLLPDRHGPPPHDDDLGRGRQIQVEHGRLPPDCRAPGLHGPVQGRGRQYLACGSRCWCAGRIRRDAEGLLWQGLLGRIWL
ncbi:hypothetical protein BGZ74_011584, partial [Mortierella antarctica]